MRDDNDTPLSQQAAEPIETPPKSWHGPVKALDGRVTKLEAMAVVTNKKLESIEQKTDAQTVILARLDKVAADPKVRAILWALVLAFLGWLAKHGVEIRVPQ